MGKALYLNERHRVPAQHLRNIRIIHKAKTQISKIEALKKIIRAWGLNPKEIITREAALLRLKAKQFILENI